MKIRFWFNHSDIMEEVKKITTYIAQTRGNESGNFLDLVNMTSQDERLFESLIYNAESEIFDSLSAYARHDYPDFYEEDEMIAEPGFELTVTLPEGANRKQVKYLNNEIRSALACYVIAEWFMIVLPSEAGMYAAKTEKHIQNVQHKLSERRKTIRRKPAFP